MSINNKKILVVGKNSFLGQNFLQGPHKHNCFKISHRELSSTFSTPNNFDVVVNFSISPSVYNKNYNLDFDTNVFIANAIKSQKHRRLILISTRQVYGVQKHQTEQSPTLPVNQYGYNKLRVENEVIKILGPDRVLILRCSNIFGLEVGRKTFMGLMSSSLLETNGVYFDFTEGTKKDFLPVKEFVQILCDVVCSDLYGVLNIGSGIGIDCGKVAKALCCGYGSGEVFYSNKKFEEDFVLDISKIQQLINYPSMSENTVLSNIEQIGRQLRQ